MARKILLADDSVTAQNMGRKILADAGYEVITVNNGSAALKKIAEHKPDLIVLDVYMPGYSGLEVCQRLKEAAETARVPVLLTVGKLEPFKPEEAKRARADGFIVKPFEASELLRVANQPQEAKAQETKPEETRAEEARVDLGALAPEGLPKDVTPEEIAALAAAAAQVKGKITESRPAEPAATDLTPEPKIEAREPAQPLTPPSQEVPAIAPLVTTFAHEKSEKEKSEEKIELPSEKSGKASQEASSDAPTSANVMAAISGLEVAASSSSSSSAGEPWQHEKGDQTADEPITMALAAGVGAGSATSRWTAVSVALAPEEAAISLEHEMQKAYAAFAAAESGHAGFAAGTAEHHATPTELSPATEFSSHTEVASPELAVPASPAPEAVQTLSAVASATTEAIRAAVQELEAVAASYVAENLPASAEPEAVPADNSAQSAPETSHAAEIAAAELAHEEHMHREPATETPAPVASDAEPEQASTTRNAEAAPAFHNEISAERTSEDSVSKPGDLAGGEPDVAQTTAAAWASWRRIRESGDEKAVPVDTSENTMAAAAGAEKHSEESSISESDPEGIASIVDSVLADLRPKIFEEISRKMGKKK